MHAESGEPVRAGYNPNWTASDDKFAYALDPSNPAFRAHLRHLFAKLTRDFGYSYLKLDFLYAAAAPGKRHDQNLTRGETLRQGLEAIRAGAGDDAFILGCGCPLGQAVGVVDGMRIGPDVSPFWGSTASGAGDPSTVYALDAIIARSFMHRRLWLNDPDCLMLRARKTRLTADERARAGRHDRRERRDAADFRRHEPARRRGGKIVSRSSRDRRGDRFQRAAANRFSHWT